VIAVRFAMAGDVQAEVGVGEGGCGGAVVIALPAMTGDGLWVGGVA